MPSGEFQDRSLNAPFDYHKSIYGNTTTTVDGLQYNWWDHFGDGLAR